MPEMDDPAAWLQTNPTDRTADTSFSNPVYDDDTRYNTGDNNNLSPDKFTTPIRPQPDTRTPFLTPGRPSGSTRLIHEEITYVAIEDTLGRALKGTGWNYTRTGITKLVTKLFIDPHDPNMLRFLPTEWELEIMTSRQHEHMDLRTIGGEPTLTIPLFKGDETFYSESTLKSNYGKHFAKRIKDILTSPEENISMDRFLNRFELFRRSQQTRAESAALVAKTFKPLKPFSDQQEHIPMTVRKPASLRSNVISQIEDIIHSDDGSIDLDALNETLMSEIDDEKLRDVFGEYDAREIRGLKIAEKKMAETRGRLVTKIAILDEQHGRETDPEKREEIGKQLAIERRSLRYLNDEHES